MKQSEFRKIIREEIQKLLNEHSFLNTIENNNINEGIIKNLTLAALLALPGISNANIPPSVEKDKIVNVVSQNNELKFKNFDEFKNYFTKNIQNFKETRSDEPEPLKVIIDNIIYDGYIGISKDMQLSITKAKSIGKKNPTHQIPVKTDNVYKSIVLIKQ
jgi:hypothetical protein